MTKFKSGDKIVIYVCDDEGLVFSDSPQKCKNCKTKEALFRFEKYGLGSVFAKCFCCNYI